MLLLKGRLQERSMVAHISLGAAPQGMPEAERGAPGREQLYQRANGVNRDRMSGEGFDGLYTTSYHVSID